MATPKGWYGTALIGGGADSLDAIDGDSLTDKDVAKVFAGNVHYEYILDADGGAGESSPDVIVPDANPGTKNWVLQQAYGAFVQQVYASLATVQTGTTAMPYDDTIPQIAEGDEYLTLAITPTNALNILLIEALFHIGHSADSEQIMALFQDATAGALSAVFTMTNAGRTTPKVLRHRMAAGTVAATTFRIRIGGASGATTTVNGTAGGRKLGGVLISSILITELRA